MFITFEGIEGTGKSTQIKLLADAFQKRGQESVITRQPGGSSLGAELRAMLLSSANTQITSQAELFLYLADRAQHIAEVVRPAVEAGKAVLCDRFADSTVAYQGYGRGLDPKLLHTLNEVAVNGCWPDLTVLLDIDPETGLRRAVSRNMRQGTCASEGRFEAESLDFHTRVREGYLTWAAINKDRIKIVDATGTVEEVFAKILAAVDALSA